MKLNGFLCRGEQYLPYPTPRVGGNLLEVDGNVEAESPGFKLRHKRQEELAGPGRCC